MGMAESKVNKTPQVRIMAFGDSLTAGYRTTFQEYTPYAATVEAEAAAAGLDGVKVEEWGLPGEITEAMTHRIDEALEMAGLPVYDIAIILGGTNDLARRIPPADVNANLAQIHAKCHAAGILTTVALGIPEHYQMHKFGGTFATARAEVNHFLESELAASTDGNVIYLSLDDAVTYFDADGLKRHDAELFWAGIHFTAAGYERIGKFVFDALLQRGLLSQP